MFSKITHLLNRVECVCVGGGSCCMLTVSVVRTKEKLLFLYYENVKRVKYQEVNNVRYTHDK